MQKAAILFLGFFLLIEFSFAQPSSSPGGIVGTPWIGQKGVTESVSEIMSRSEEFARLIPKQPRQPREEEGEVERAEQKENPNSPMVANWPPSSVPAPAMSLNPQIVGTSFLAMQVSESGYIPPDNQGSVGPTQILACANGVIKVFDKSGVLGPLNTTTDNFFNSVRNGSGTSDPRVRYDRTSGRWIVTIINVATPNRILIAVSSGSTITGAGSFTFYQFQHDLVGTTPNSDTGGFADYNLLGVDVNALYIGQNVYNAAGTAIIGTTAFVVRKSSILSGGPIVVTAFRQIGAIGGGGGGPWTPQGVDNDDPTATEGYFIGTDNSVFGQLDIRRVSTPAGTPTLSGNLTITVPSTQNPIKQRHLGAAANRKLDALDDRLFAAMMHKNKITGVSSLWTAHSFQVNASGVASTTGGRNGSRWYEITNLTATPTLNQSGTLFDSAPTDSTGFWVPGIAMSGQGHAALGSSRAGVNARAEIAVAGRLSGDALGTLQTYTLAQSSSTNYNVEANNSQRWGDYTLTVVDPNDDMTMWTFQEYCNASNSWGLRAIQLIAPPPATPASSSPPSIAVGQASVNVTITGTQITGSGFFDPGSGYANHIAASVSGGVVVNSATFVNPTTVTLNLNTTSATTGAKNVTITNPDGQALTGTSILTITSAASIAVTSPNGAETWTTGSSQTINWTSSGISGSVNVELSRNGGSSYEALFAGSANDGSELWVVTGPATATALIRISSVSNPSVLDVSNSQFTISSSFSLLTRIYLRDNGGALDSLEYGTGASATDGIDGVFGEFELPPLPPTGVLDVRWQIAGTLGTERDTPDTLCATHQPVIYTGKLQAGEGGYPFVLKWNHLELPAGTFTLRDGPAGAFFLVNMKLQDSLVISDDQIPQFQIVYDAGNVVSSTAQTGWNILSLPVTVGDRRKTVVFPTSTSNAFAYTPIGYVNDDTLDYGVGYWLKFPSTQSLSLTGGVIATDTIDVIQGWNIIGSVSTPVPVGSIIQIPSGIVASSYFGYGIIGYASATSINPMGGYWVKVNQNGKLVLPGSALLLRGTKGGRGK